MKVFVGVRTHKGCQVCWWDTEAPGKPQPLDMANHVWNHSPDGAEWGYGGSGPAQLALAMLVECTDDPDFAVQLHQDVKRALVATLPREIWARTELDILRCAARLARTPESIRQANIHLDRAMARCSKKEKDGNV